MGPESLLVGVDVGGSKIAVLVTDREYRVRGQAAIRTPLDSAESTLSGIAEAVWEGVQAARASMDDVAAVGMGTPGRVDPQTGVVRQAVNLRWHNVPAGEMLSERLGVPCKLHNDATLAAVGARRYLGDPIPQDIVYVGVGTGIAAGLILSGRIYRGAHGLAGEIGHMVIDPEGSRCQCGGRGCLEAMAAGPAIARLGEEAAARSEDTLLWRSRPLTAEAVYQAAREGDAAAQAIARKVGSYLALALQQLIAAYDPEYIVLGGGVAHNGEAFLRPVLVELARVRKGSVLTEETLQPDKIRVLPGDYNAGAWGAVLLAAGDPVTIPYMGGK